MREQSALQALTWGTSDDEADEAHRGLPTLPWAFVGMGFLIAWLCCTHLPGMFVSTLQGARMDMAVDYGMRVGDIGTFLAVIALSRGMGSLSDHRKTCAALVVLGAVCTYAAPLLARPDAAVLPLGLVGVGAGIGGAVLFVLWSEVYAKLGPSRCVLFGSVACLVAGLVALIASHLDRSAANALIAALPVVSGVLAGISLGRLPRMPRLQGGAGAAGAGRPAVRYPVPVKLVALMALAGFVSGFAGSLLVQIDGLGAVHRIQATVLFGTLLLVLFVVRRGSFDARILAWVTLPLAVVSFSLIPFAGQVAGVMLSFLVKLSYVSFALFVLLVLANVVYRHDIPSDRVFASARAASEGAMFAGILLRRWMQGAGLLDSGEMLLVITVAGLVVIVGCVLVWHSEKSVTSDWGTAGVDAASGLRVVTERERVLARVGELAVQCGLTPREREILELVAQDRDATAIEQELFVSHNTLKTHLRHIYAKLGVHGRAEAMELVRG